MSTLTHAIVALVLAVNPLADLLPLQEDRTLRPLEESDPNRDAVRKEVERIERTKEDSPVGNRVTRVGRIESTDATTLFPGWAFYSIEFSNYMKPGFEEALIGLAFGLGETFAVPPGAGEPMALFHSGNYEAFGELLKRTQVTVGNTGDAKRVWDAFCGVHRKSWRRHPIEEVSTTEWKLGVYSYDQGIADDGKFRTIVKQTHFKRLTIDPESQRVAGWKSVVETSDERREPAR